MSKQVANLELNCEQSEMNEWYIFIALYCCTPKALYNNVGVSPQQPPVCSIHLDDATAATGQLTTHQLQVERRESHRANQVDGDV